MSARLAGSPDADAGTSGFLGTLTPGGTVTKANGRGIFVNFGNLTYTTIARVTDPAGATGATFSVLKDPALASGIWNKFVDRLLVSVPKANGSASAAPSHSHSVAASSM